jgi:DNA modification methylase
VIGYSLGKFQQVKPIVVNDRTGIIVAGNGTVTRAIDDGATHIVAVFGDWTDEEAAELALLDNRSAQLADWDESQLAETIGEFPDLDWSAGGWEPADFEDFEVDWPLAETTTVEEHVREIGGEDSEDDGAEDEIHEPPAEPITKPGDVIQIGPHVLHCADCMDVLRSLPDNSVDAIVTDPPYGLSPDGRARTWDDIEALRAEGKGPKGGFMGRAWDAGVPGITWARECLRVLKPGGHLVAASATRTVHRLTCAIEDAGFEIRDAIHWLHYQGFPKSHDVSKAIDHLHGAERKVVGHGKAGATTMGAGGHGGLAGGFGYTSDFCITVPATEDAKRLAGWGTALKPAIEPFVLSRKPLSEKSVAENVLKWGTGALNIDACRIAPGDPSWPGPDDGDDDRWPANVYHCPKPATSERNDVIGLAAPAGDVRSDGGAQHTIGVKMQPNYHPTVKPVRLMRWLLRLVTPPDGTVLEPFGGSGTTLVAAAGLDCKVIVAEREPGYCDIIRARGLHSLAAK